MVNIEIKAYSKEYKEGVIDCLKRNYSWMKKRKWSNQEIYKWLQPLVEYSWKDMELLQEIPCKYGVVLLHNAQVVGFLGCIYSVRKDINKNSYIQLVPTTLAIDEKWRFYTVKILSTAFKYADLIFDVSACIAVEKILTQVFKCEKVSTRYKRVYPSLFLGKRNLIIKDIIDVMDIDSNDEILRQEYIDNSPYEVKWIECSTSKFKEKVYVAYRLFKRQKKYREKTQIQIIKVSDKEVFNKNIKEIFAYIHSKYWCNIECDCNFLKENTHKFWLSKKKKSTKLLLIKKNNIIPSYDYLYSEDVM